MAARLEPLRSKMAHKDGVEAAEATRPQLEAVRTVRPGPGRAGFGRSGRELTAAGARGGGSAWQGATCALGSLRPAQAARAARAARRRGRRGGGALRAEEMERLDSLLERRREAREHRARLLAGLESVTLQARLRPPSPPAPARARR